MRQAFTGNITVTIAASIRFFLLKGINYHDHVTEWGVHWSFFMTIASLAVLSTFIRSPRFAMIYGLGLLLVTELLARHWDLETFILYSPRSNLFSANREGILSLAGYHSIQLIGIGIGAEFYKTLIFMDPAKL